MLEYIKMVSFDDVIQEFYKALSLFKLDPRTHWIVPVPYIPGMGSLEAGTHYSTRTVYITTSLLVQPNWKFVIYHEVGHLSITLDGPSPILGDYCANEIEADRLACSVLRQSGQKDVLATEINCRRIPQLVFHPGQHFVNSTFLERNRRRRDT